MPFLSFSTFSRFLRGVKDPTQSMREELLKDPENDELQSEIIQREQHDVQRGDQGYIND